MKEDSRNTEEEIECDVTEASCIVKSDDIDTDITNWR